MATRPSGLKQLIALAVVAGCVCTAAVAGELSREQRLELIRGGRVEAPVITALDERGAARVIVQFVDVAPAAPMSRAAIDRVLADLPRESLAPVGYMRSLPAIAALATSEGILGLAARAEVRGVFLDLPVRTQLAEAVPLTGLLALHQMGQKGKGVRVAVIDTGIDFTQPSLRPARRSEQCFCENDLGGCCPNGLSEQSGAGSAVDDSGHGTLVAGIVASRGRGGAPRGTAPKAKIVAIKTLGADGSGFVSNSFFALDWILEVRSDVSVVNMSLGSDRLFGGRRCDTKGNGIGEIYAFLVDALRERGTMVVAASGNDGKKKMSMPACIENVISVGAYYDSDFAGTANWGICQDLGGSPNELTCFSNAGKRMDMAAPGAFITSVSSDGGTATVGGTSMATPMVTGCLAVLMKAFPTALPDDLEAALKGSPRRATHVPSGRGYPSLDCESAFAILEAQGL